MGNLLTDPILDIPGPWEGQLTSDIAPQSGGGPSSQIPLLPAMTPRGDLPVEPAQTSHYEGGGIFSEAVSGPPEMKREEEGQLMILPDVQPMSPQQGYMDLIPPLPQQGPMTELDYMPAGGPLQQAVGGVPPSQGHMLGMLVIGAATGSVIGYRYGGAYGATAGAVFSGSLMNAYRAFAHLRDGTPEGKREAMVSGTYAVGAAALGSLIWWKLVSSGRDGGKRSYTANRCRANGRSCGIRSAGP